MFFSISRCQFGYWMMMGGDSFRIPFGLASPHNQHACLPSKNEYVAKIIFNLLLLLCFQCTHGFHIHSLAFQRHGFPRACTHQPVQSNNEIFSFFKTSMNPGWRFLRRLSRMTKAKAANANATAPNQMWAWPIHRFSVSSPSTFFKKSFKKFKIKKKKNLNFV